MADTVKQIGIKQQDGTYSMKDIEVDYSNVTGLSTQATSAKAVGDKNNKDITTYIASGSHSGSNLVLTNGAGTSSNVGLGMTGATSNANGEAGFVPQPTSADVNKFLKANGTWDVPPGKTYIGSSNISINSSTNAIDLTNTTVSSGTYGPSADVTGTNGTTISVPNISVDAKGRITNITNKTYTSVDTGSKVFTGSLSEWNQLSTAKKKTYDFISNDEPGGILDRYPAERVSFDNTVSGLTATDVQGAVDELADEFIAPDYAHAVFVTPNTTYSVLNDGYFIAARLFGSTAGNLININGLNVTSFNPGGARDMGACIYPVKKGDTVITSNLDTTNTRLYFAPYRR